MKERFPEDYSLWKFQTDFKDWYFEYIYKDNRCIGATISRNGYIHIGIIPEYRKKWATKNEIRFLISSSMKDGVAKTTIFRDDQFRINFAKRLGFKMIEDKDIQTYEVSYENLWK
jgi:hypothetical protein